MTRILFSHGVEIGPHDDIVRGRGKITYRTASLSSSHVQSDDNEAEEEEEVAAEEEANDTAAPP